MSVKRRRLRWAGDVARMEEGRRALNNLVINLQERDLAIDGRTILEWTLKKYQYERLG